MLAYRILGSRLFGRDGSERDYFEWLELQPAYTFWSQFVVPPHFRLPPPGHDPYSPYDETIEPAVEWYQRPEVVPREPGRGGPWSARNPIPEGRITTQNLPEESVTLINARFVRWINLQSTIFRGRVIVGEQYIRRRAQMVGTRRVIASVPRSTWIPT